MTAWSSLPTTDVDADSPGDTDLATALVNRDLHLREFLTGATPRYNDRTPHDHSGIGGDVAIHSVSSPNLVLNPCPANGTDDGHWFSQGVTTDATTQTLCMGATTSDYLYQILLRDKFTTSTGYQLFGSGSPLVLSFFALAGAGTTTGTLHVGIADNSVATYKTGHDFTLLHSQLSTTVWRRFYCVADATSNSPPTGTDLAGASHSVDVRFLFSVDSGNAFDADFYFTGFSACASDGQLIPFDWGPGEHSAEGYGRVHGENRQPKAPVWSTQVGMTNAVELTTRA